ncbi:putative NAD(P)/FAD-binding protein YdhS [Rhizobium azooxidifex]|uniref:Putative NAD(P)/FAD-binding protein YdhS n=1 Tax=Mycoplana azooxidifex TaxID=1636188 RepID=A0A7W6GIN4_9HYPH|nr:FAD/NAD(P)-binding protein [Mycoplana azooxidifex]MBB3976670.1 putative NAD(P)/FAD-binding protein YdhS [Mycoplana azooxidifex]
MTLVSARFPHQPNEADGLSKIAIVGRGFTGLMTAIALLKTVDRPFHLVLYDPHPKIDNWEEIGRPASTLLNSRVRDLSVNPAAREDFRRWLEARRNGGEVAAGNVDHAFVPGEVFSAYVYQRFSEALRERTDVVVQLRADSVTAIDRHSRDGLSVSSGEGGQARFDAVFLATGYGLRDGADANSDESAPGEAVVIGGGVHAVDRALRLLSAGEASHVTLISASGFLPQPHTASAVGAVSSGRPFPNTLLGAFRHLREAANRAALEGSGWQGIMNDFRLRARDLWQSLTPEERRRFKRHVKPIYDSHRNRLPPGHYERLRQAITSGAITVRKGKVERLATNGVLLSTAAGLQVLAAGRTIDCRIRPTDLGSPLYRSLFLAGLVRRDELDLGVFVDRSGRAIVEGERFDGLFAMGPLGLGSLPDIDLVPEIVVQAYAAAEALGVWLPDRKTVRASKASAHGTA